VLVDLLGVNPYQPTYSEYDEASAELMRGLRGLTHFSLKEKGRTVLDTFPKPGSPEQAIPGIRFGIEQLLSMGITTVFEAGAHWEHYEALSLLKERGELKVRFELYLTSEHLDELVDRGITRHDGDEWVRILGVKLYTDGWLGSRTSALREAYSDKIYSWQLDPEYRGILFMEQDQIINDVFKAHAAGLKIATHANGDKATELVLNAYENALDEFPVPDHRHTIEHAEVLAPDLVQRIKQLEVICSIQLSFATSDMHFMEKALGSERMSHAYAWRTLLQEGIRCAGGSDFNVEVISPLWGIQRIVTRQELNGLPENGWYPAQCLSVEEALRLITIDSAYNSFEEDIKGSIEVGKLADMVILSQDILDIPPNEIAETVVEMTMVGGEIAYVWPESKLW
jgi:predicted amidohydrolase YtcJ